MSIEPIETGFGATLAAAASVAVAGLAALADLGVPLLAEGSAHQAGDAHQAEAHRQESLESIGTSIPLL